MEASLLAMAKSRYQYTNRILLFTTWQNFFMFLDHILIFINRVSIQIRKNLIQIYPSISFFFFYD